MWAGEAGGSPGAEDAEEGQQAGHTQATPQPHSSKYRGVAYNKKCRKWQAVINTNSRHVHLGTFVNEEDAALAFDRAAVICWGQQAKLNFLLTNYTRPDGTFIHDREVEQKLLSALSSPVLKRPRNRQVASGAADTATTSSGGADATTPPAEATPRKLQRAGSGAARATAVGGLASTDAGTGSPLSRMRGRHTWPATSAVATAGTSGSAGRTAPADEARAGTSSDGAVTGRDGPAAGARSKLSLQPQWPQSLQLLGSVQQPAAGAVEAAWPAAALGGDNTLALLQLQFQQQQRQHQEQQQQNAAANSAQGLQASLQAALPPGCHVRALMYPAPWTSDSSDSTVAVVFSTPSGATGAALWHNRRLHAVRRFATPNQAADHCEALTEVVAAIMHSSGGLQGAAMAAPALTVHELRTSPAPPASLNLRTHGTSTVHVEAAGAAAGLQMLSGGELRTLAQSLAREPPPPATTTAAATGSGVAGPGMGAGLAELLAQYAMSGGILSALQHTGGACMTTQGTPLEQLQHRLRVGKAAEPGHAQQQGSDNLAPVGNAVHAPSSHPTQLNLAGMSHASSAPVLLGPSPAASWLLYAGTDTSSRVHPALLTPSGTALAASHLSLGPHHTAAPPPPPDEHEHGHMQLATAEVQGHQQLVLQHTWVPAPAVFGAMGGAVGQQLQPRLFVLPSAPSSGHQSRASVDSQTVQTLAPPAAAGSDARAAVLAPLPSVTLDLGNVGGHTYVLDPAALQVPVGGVGAQAPQQLGSSVNVLEAEPLAVLALERVSRLSCSHEQHTAEASRISHSPVVTAPAGLLGLSSASGTAAASSPTAVAARYSSEAAARASGPAWVQGSALPLPSPLARVSVEAAPAAGGQQAGKTSGGKGTE